eukprot:TRINITY_DN2058_c0_g4_i3.p1 TRINITY_DN2058_c0_g4~~TRINITY_DN2058_c0_g4_i3.p1  ORF type:complete len:120 (-),score=16.49 TRINITY_DN2058_c0_g4_i3:28-387(-)
MTLLTSSPYLAHLSGTIIDVVTRKPLSQPIMTSSSSSQASSFESRAIQKAGVLVLTYTGTAVLEPNSVVCVFRPGELTTVSLSHRTLLLSSGTLQVRFDVDEDSINNNLFFALLKTRFD